MNELNKTFFSRDTVLVAKELIGKIIQVGSLKGRIVETEAYSNDASSHAAKKTKRSSVMFETYGHAYVYFIYGMYYCLNFTTEKNNPGAVLIRALEPLEGVEVMKKNRGTAKIENLCSGPGKLCQALGIDKSFNFLELGNKIKVLDDRTRTEFCASTRIGISKAKDLEWRFFAKNCRFISR